MLLYVSVIDMLNLVVACRNKCAGSLVDKQHLLLRIPDEILEYDITLLQEHLTEEAWKTLNVQGLLFVCVYEVF